MAGYLGTKAVLLSTTAATVTGSSTVGAGLTVDNDGATVLTVDRATSNGTIIDVQKGGTTVGSIGNRFGAMYVHSPDGTNGSGLRFHDGIIQPCESNGNDSDGDTDLGQLNSRFRDIYLSGAVKFKDGGGGADTVYGVDNHVSAGYTTATDTYWHRLASKGGTHIVLNTDGARTTSRNHHDHFTVWQKDSDQTNGRLCFAVDNGGAAHFGSAGVSIDRGWDGYPSITVFRDSFNGDNNTSKNEFRVHGSHLTAAWWHGGSTGSDFSVTFRIDGGTYYSSDRRKKTNIESVANALDTVMQIDGKRFQIVNSEGEAQTSLSKSGYKYGFIAQDIEDVIPDAVKYYSDEDDGTENYNNSYSVDYASVVALLTNAIKELKEENNAMRARLDALEAN